MLAPSSGCKQHNNKKHPSLPKPFKHLNTKKTFLNATNESPTNFLNNVFLCFIVLYVP